METISRELLTFLLNSLWQIPLIAGVAALACRLMRNGPATHRQAVWVAALAAAVLLPLCSMRREDPTASVWLDPSMIMSAAPSPQSATHALLPPTLAAKPAPAPLTVSLAETTAAMLIGAYVLFMLFRLARLALAARRTVALRRAAHAAAVSEPLNRVWNRCQAAFGLTDVELLFSDEIAGALTAGRTIILSEALRGESSEEVLTTAIGHEMAHIARRDFAHNLLYEVLRLPVSYHPAAWLIRRGIEGAREMACDEMVAGRLIEAGAYARSIMSIAAGMMAPPRLGHSLSVLDGDNLEERIRRLVERPVANLKRARLLLATGLAALAICVVVASSLALTARAQDGASDLMKNGVAAYNRGEYREAVSQFQITVGLEPANLKAKLFLAHALLRQYLPGSPVAALAQQQYSDVLAIDPQNKAALQGMMQLYANTKQFTEAHDWALKAIQADATDKTAYYTAGFLDWAMTYPDYAMAVKAAGMRLDDPGNISDASLRQSLREKHGAQIEDGFHMLQIALQLDPGYSDAMAFMNLLSRIHAGIADTPEQAASDIAKANHWVDQALAAKRRAASNPPTKSADLNGLQDPPIFAPPPPPPPPPPPGSPHNEPLAQNAPVFQGPLRVGGRVQQAKLISPALQPVYPPAARAAGVSGEVAMEVTLAKDGSVTSVVVLSGDAMLAPAAVEAVRQWKYQPTLLNLQPIEVITDVTVNFTLGQ